jgi:negative regulator of flagellin synthesis FlgM
MQISDNEIKKLLDSRNIVEAIVEIDKQHSRAADQELVAHVTRKVIEMPDREDRIAELKAKIEAGTYNVSGAEIADSMIKRSIADRLD